MSEDSNNFTRDVRKKPETYETVNLADDANANIEKFAFQLLKDLSVNRSGLTGQELQKTANAYRRALSVGAEPMELVKQWEEVQTQFQERGTSVRDFPQLLFWLREWTREYKASLCAD